MKFFIDPIAKMFELIHKMIQGPIPNANISYGLTIILVTILIRIILLPLNIKQIKSMLKMSEMQPEIKKLQDKYKNDPQKAQTEMMKLYKENGASPLSGCLPVLIQMPIIIALYSVFNNLQGIKGVGFLWLKDLSASDPYFILPILAGITTYISTKISQPATMDSAQAKQTSTMNIVTAGMIVFMGWKLKSALVLYWVVNYLIQIIQTLAMKKFDHKKPVKN